MAVSKYSSGQELTKPRPLGFPQVVTPSRPGTIAPGPTPLPKRPKGRWFLGAILVAVAVLVSYSVWDSFFRFRAYGVVEARVVEVPSPWSGNLQKRLVNEGDRVQQGQVLVIIDSTELRRQLGQVEDDLSVAKATLESETARLKAESAYGLDQTVGVLSTYYETMGRYLQAESQLQDYRANYRRAEKLLRESPEAISREEYDRIRYQMIGQEKLVARLKDSLVELKPRVELTESLLTRRGELAAGQAESAKQQLKPTLARIEMLQNERSRLRAKLEEGTIRAPVDGVVVKFHRLPAELCEPGNALVSVLEEKSLRVVLYMSQRSSALLNPGDTLQLTHDPDSTSLDCVVTRLGDRYEPAPECIKRYYYEGQTMLPIYLQLDAEQAAAMRLDSGSVVKMPYGVPRFLKGKVQ